MILFLFKLFIFLVVLGLYCCTRAFSSYGERGLLSSYGVQASHRGGFSCSGAWAQQLQHADLVALGHVESFQTRDQTHVLCISRQILYH